MLQRKYLDTVELGYLQDHYESVFSAEPVVFDFNFKLDFDAAPLLLLSDCDSLK